MPLLFGGLAFLLGAVAAFPRLAQAQGTDTLPSLDESPPVVAPDSEPVPAQPEPEPVVVLQAPRQKPAALLVRPIRARRRLALLGEIGWNGIAGFGPMLAYHVHPHVSFDLGAGLSLLGWKVGLRSRYNFLTGPVTPFLGLALMGAAGFGDSPIPISEKDPDPTRDTVNVKILPSAWAQAVLGVDWIAPSGFTLIGAGGYAWLLSHDPVQVVTGKPNAEEQMAFDVAFRSSVVITLALGYAFR